MNNFKKDFGTAQRKLTVKEMNVRANDSIKSDRKESIKSKACSIAASVAIPAGLMCVGLLR